MTSPIPMPMSTRWPSRSQDNRPATAGMTQNSIATAAAPNVLTERTYSEVHSVALSSTTAATAAAPFQGSWTALGVRSANAPAGSSPDRFWMVLLTRKSTSAQKRCLVHPACRQAQQRHEEKHQYGIDPTGGEQPVGACGKYRHHAQRESHEAPAIEALIEEQGSEYRGDDGVHRDDHGPQYRGSSVFEGLVQRAELHRLHE